MKTPNIQNNLLELLLSQLNVNVVNCPSVCHPWTFCSLGQHAIVIQGGDVCLSFGKREKSGYGS